MVESFKDNRVVFENKNAQNIFLELAKKGSGKTLTQFAKELSVCTRTLRTWRNGTAHISERAVNDIHERFNIPIPKISRKIVWTEHLKNISSSGGKANFKKNGAIGNSSAERINAWQKWWETDGQFRKHTRAQVFLPKHSALLAEFVGIVLGDGGLTKYQVMITLNKFADSEYILFVARLAKTLFKITPKTRFYPNNLSRKSVIVIEISSREIVEYLVELGLHVGNKVKQQVEVPDWIKSNSEFRVACLRGLVDTDGCVFTNSYQVNGKTYKYKKIAFTNRSVPLLKFACDTWSQLGFRPCTTRNIDVRLVSTADVNKHMKLVGTSNPKHLKRYVN